MHAKYPRKELVCSVDLLSARHGAGHLHPCSSGASSTFCVQASTLEQGHGRERTDKVPALARKWGQIRGSENK